MRPAALCAICSGLLPFIFSAVDVDDAKSFSSVLAVTAVLLPIGHFGIRHELIIAHKWGFELYIVCVQV